MSVLYFLRNCLLYLAGFRAKNVKLNLMFYDQSGNQVAEINHSTVLLVWLALDFDHINEEAKESQEEYLNAIAEQGEVNVDDIENTQVNLENAIDMSIQSYFDSNN